MDFIAAVFKYWEEVLGDKARYSDKEVYERLQTFALLKQPELFGGQSDLRVRIAMFDLWRSYDNSLLPSPDHDRARRNVYYVFAGRF